MNILKIGFFGDGPWAHNSLDLLVKDKKVSISFICARNQNPDPILKSKAINLGIDFFNESDINSKHFLKKLSSYNCDLYVSMSFDQIFKTKLFSLPRLGTINCHAGKLPFYRGRNVLNWVLINDEREFGITVHYVDEGIDTGDIIIQKVFPIFDSDNYDSLLKVAYENCALLLHSAINLIINKKVKRIKQDQISKHGLYCSKRIEGDEIINWNNSSREIFNFIRALTLPGPCAKTYLNKSLVKIISAEEIQNAPNYIGIPGIILTKNEENFYVKTSDSYLKVTKWSSKVNLKVGSRLL